jgi:glucokinase
LGRAGHLGHISLNPTGPGDIVNTPGSLEDAIGEHTLARRSAGRYRSTDELLAAVRVDDATASAIWLKSIQALGAATASLVNVLDPDLVLIGGGIADADEELFGPLRQVLDKFEWRPGGAKVRVMKAALGSNAGAAGAAHAAASLH